MSANTFPSFGRRTVIASALAGFIALLAGLAILTGPGNQADAAPGKAVYLGKASAKRIALCPERCQSVVIVSGFQAKAGGIGNAYRVPFVGNVTRWRLKLGKPTMKDRAFFQQRFGAVPQAAIGILAKKEQGGKIVYKLRRRSAIQNLNRFLGKTATFNLAQPIKVNKGDYVALIVPTWAPALSVPEACSTVMVNGKAQMKNPPVCRQFNANNSWVASRDRTTCSQAVTMKNSQPQIDVNSLASYGCRFNGALTYGVRVESR
ncbi:MAG: hypothetical protein KDB66_10890 [Solirubrobacterales bacterium]|nr:hypothetical protein [Solirubrobacterales bacterium]MCB8915054.1 hypothetical protein [Thermoleophilales bacterium]